MKTALNIAGAALNQTPLDEKGNRERILSALQLAKEQAVDVLCFSELALTSYGCEDLFLTKDIFDKSWKSLLLIAKQAPEELLCAIGMPLYYREKPYNALAIIYKREVRGFYLKQNLAKQGVYYEPRWFEAWPAARQEKFVRAHIRCPIGEWLLQHKGYTIGFEICEDAWSASRPANRYAKADLILSAHASHFALRKAAQRKKLVIESSKRYNCTYVYVNMLGNDAGRLVYEGDILMAHQGVQMAAAQAPVFGDIKFVSAAVAERQTAEAHVSDNQEFTDAAVLALFDYLRKSHAKGFVLSASGGADSSMCAVLVAEMIRRAIHELGIEGFLNVFSFLRPYISTQHTDLAVQQAAFHLLTMVYQASAHSSATTLRAAQALSQQIGAHFIHWSIDHEVQSYTEKVSQAIDRKLSWEKDDLALQNIQARARTPGLWLLANIKEALLLTTSNRSEGAVGYATMDGDMAGSLAPLASVSKPFILQWLRWAAQTLGYDLTLINSLSPTAELRPASEAQTDEQDLMPYHILLAIEQEAIMNKYAPAEVFDALARKKLCTEQQLKMYIHKFFTLFVRNQWKRERLAPSFHLDSYSIDPKSWYRFPILSAGYTDEWMKS